MLRIALADDSVLLREGLVALLTHVGHQVVAAVGDAAALAAAAADERPDIGAIFAKLDLPPESDDHDRRVRAVLTYLRS